MNITSSRMKESIKVRQEILDCLKENEITLADVINKFNLTRTLAVSYINSLKRLNLIESKNTTDGKSKTNYIYVLISDSKLIDVLAQSKLNQVKKSRDKVNQIITERQKSLHPCGKVYTMEDFGHRSVGNKHKVNAWSGYSTF